jgi:uncharacterized membrane protein
MTERSLRLAGAALAAAGAALSAYLLYVRETGATLVCATGGCETVQESSYAELAGIPVAALGVAGFAALFACAVARGETARLAQATLALAAVLFSGYLLYVQIAVVDAICQWCLASDVLATAIAAVAVLRFRAVDSGLG